MKHETRRFNTRSDDMAVQADLIRSGATSYRLNSIGVERRVEESNEAVKLAAQRYVK